MSSRLLPILLALSLTLSRVSCSCDDSHLEVGFFYSCQLSGDSFFQDDVPVSISAAVKDRAGLPEWLTLDVTNSTSPSFIYGTPGTVDVGTITLQITAIRMDTNESELKEVRLTVSTAEGNILQKSELFITNFDLEDFLSDEVQSLFNSTLSGVYGQMSGAVPSLLRVIHPSARGIPVPVPPAKHGVIVQVSPGLDILITTPSSSLQTNCENSFTQFFTENGFQLNSCTFMAYTIETGSPASTTDGMSDRPLPPGSDSSISLVVILVLGVVVMVMIITGLAWVFFGGRKRGFYVSHKKRVQRSTMRGVSKTTSKGPVTSQTHLRDLAQQRTKKPNVVAMEEGRPKSVNSSQGLLEFQDMTDYSNPESNSSADSQPPPPVYTYPKGIPSSPPAQNTQII